MAGAKEGASPRASKPAAAGDKKPKAKKPKGSAPTAPMTLGMPMQKPEALSEEQAKADLAEMQKKYGTLVVTFNNQQAELAAAQKLTQQLEAELEALKASQGSMPVEDSVQALRTQLEQTSAVSCSSSHRSLGPPGRPPDRRRARCQARAVGSRSNLAESSLCTRLGRLRRRHCDHRHRCRAPLVVAYPYHAVCSHLLLPGPRPLSGAESVRGSEYGAAEEGQQAPG